MGDSLARPRMRGTFLFAAALLAGTPALASGASKDCAASQAQAGATCPAGQHAGSGQDGDPQPVPAPRVKSGDPAALETSPCSALPRTEQFVSAAAAGRRA